MIVVSRYHENVSWVHGAAQSWQMDGMPAGYAIYDKANPSSIRSVPVNKGAEGSAYLLFVLQHFHDMPEWSFFVHGAEVAWHHEGTLGERLRHVWQLAHDTSRLYLDINHYKQIGGLDKARGPLLGEEEVDERRRVTPSRLQEWRRQYLEPLVDFRSANADWVRGSACCAQFLVHRRQILRYPLRFYRRLYSWSIDASRDDYVEGRFLEYAWHVIWGDDEARRPDESQHACGLGHSRRCTKFEMEQRRHNEAEGDLEDEL